MATTVVLTNGNSDHEVDLVYAAGSQTNFNLRRGSSLASPEVDVLAHQSDRQDGALPIHVNHADREAFFTLMVFGSDWDTVLGNVAKCQRLLNDASRYWTDGDVDRVYLQVQFDGATSPTYIDVKWGHLDTGPLWSSASQLNKKGINLPVRLVLAPFGYGDEIELENLLDNSGFEEWHSGTTDSEPDSWTDEEDAGITGTNNQESSEVPLGQYALKIAVTNSTGATQDKGVQQAIDAARLTPGETYTFVCRYKTAGFSNGSVQIGVEGTNTGSQWAVNGGAAASDWTVAAVSFTMHASDTTLTARARVRSSGASCSGTVYVDGLLLMAGDYETEAEDGRLPWMSGSYVVNHYDDGAGDINYVDMADVPYDAEAQTKLKVYRVTNDAGAIFGLLGGGRGRVVQAIATPHEAEDWTAGTLGFYSTSTPSDAACSGGQYLRVTAGASGSARLSTDVTLSDHYPPNLLVVGRVRVSAVDATVQLGYGIDPSPPNTRLYPNKPVTFVEANAWQWVVLGVLPTGEGEGAPTNRYLVPFVFIGAEDSGDTIDIDCLLLIDAGRATFGSVYPVASGSGDYWEKRSENRHAYFYDSSESVHLVASSHIGAPLRLPADTDLRLFLFHTHAAGGLDIPRWESIDTEVKVVLGFTPRTNHLFGAAS